MTRTRSARRHARQRARGINRELAAAERDVPRQPADDPAADTLARRARMSAVPLADAGQPWHGDAAGRALAAHAPAAELRALWEAFCRIDAAWTVYAARILGRSPHPAVMRAELRRERLEASASDPIDPRSADERDLDALRRWRAMDASLSRLPIAEHVAVRLALARDERLLTGGRGVLLVAALRKAGGQPCGQSGGR